MSQPPAALPNRTSDRRVTYADYCSWPEDERWELIDGVANDMSPVSARIRADLTKNQSAQ